MAHKAEVLHVKRRDSFGSRQSRRMRSSGAIPAVLYGHGEATLTLAVPADELSTALRHGSRFVDLSGDLSEKALVTQIQWDVWGNHILHVDFTRVSEHEKVHLKVPVELRGEAPGIKEGGVIMHIAHEFMVECDAADVPEKISVTINDLHLNGHITVAQLKLPAGVTVMADADDIVVQCVPPAEEKEEAPELEAGAQPEVIGRVKEEDSEE